jgi:hypothetical protein
MTRRGADAALRLRLMSRPVVANPGKRPATTFGLDDSVTCFAMESREPRNPLRSGNPLGSGNPLRSEARA